MQTMASNTEMPSRGLELEVPGVELCEYMCSKTFSTSPRGKRGLGTQTNLGRAKAPLPQAAQEGTGLNRATMCLIFQSTVL